MKFVIEIFGGGIVCFAVLCSVVVGGVVQNSENDLGALRKLAQECAAKSKGFEGDCDLFYYPVELPVGSALSQDAAVPFCLGSGSHEDNSLLRSFIALEAWDDARKEFARVWELHRSVAKEKGFDGLGLSFAIDYAYFLEKIVNEPQQARAILTEALLVMDMDRNPNLVPFRRENGELTRLMLVNRRRPRRVYSPHVTYMGVTLGFSRREFIRIVVGAACTDGWDDQLKSSLNVHIADGENSIRRVLAYVFFYEEDIHKALSLEKDYLEASSFHPAVQAYLLGCLCEEYNELEQAEEMFKSVLSMSIPAGDLSGSIEVTEEREAMNQNSSTVIVPGRMTRLRGSAVNADSFDRLERIQRLLGKFDCAFATMMARIERNPLSYIDMRKLKSGRKMADLYGFSEEFTTRMERIGETELSSQRRLELSLFLKKYDEAISYAVDVYMERKVGLRKLNEWVVLFSEAGDEVVSSLLHKLMACREDSYAVQLLLVQRSELKLSLADRIKLQEALVEADGNMFRSYDQSSEKNHYETRSEVVYDLMRLYEQSGQRRELVSLGLRLLRRDPPFEKMGPLAVDAKRLVRDDVGLSCILIMLSHVKTEEERQALKIAAAPFDSKPLKRQVARVLGESEEAGPCSAVTIYTPAENKDLYILTNRDDIRGISGDGRWLGTPWGLVGNGAHRVVQILLEEPVDTIKKLSGKLYVAVGKSGLYWLGNPDLCEGCPVKIPLSGFSGRLIVQELDDSYSIWVKGPDSKIWNIRSSGPDCTNTTLKGYSASSDGTMFFEHETAVCTDRALFDKKSDRFVVPSLEPFWMEGARDVSTSDDVFSFVEKCKNHGARKRNPVRLIGSAGRMLWGVYDFGKRGIIPVLINDETFVAKPLPCFLDSGTVKSGLYMRDIRVLGFRDGVTWFAKGSDDDPFAVYLHNEEHWLFLKDNTELSKLPGYELFCRGRNKANVASLECRPGDLGQRKLLDYKINNLRVDEEAGLLYVCTDRGLSIVELKEGFPIKRHVRLLDGLPSSSVIDAKRVGKHLILACRFRNGRGVREGKGALAVQNLETGLIQQYHVRDGLLNAPIRSLMAEGGKLRIFCDPGSAADAVKSTVFNVDEGSFENCFKTVADDFPERTVYWKEWTFWSKSYGLLIYRDISYWDMTEPVEQEYRVVEHDDSLCEQIAIARMVSERGAEHVLPALREALDDDDSLVRAYATLQLCRVGEIPSLPSLLDGLIAAGMYESDSVDREAILDALAATVKTEEQFAILCACKTNSGRVARILQKHPHWLRTLLAVPLNKHGSYASKVIWEIGDASRERKHIAAARTSRDGLRDAPGEWDCFAIADAFADDGPWEIPSGRNNTDERYLLEEVDEDLLRGLHDALKGDDRIVIANAAAGCGAWGSTSSVPHLIAALDFESGLSRASCVQALGALKASDAAPRLMDMYRYAGRQELVHGACLDAEIVSMQRRYDESIADMHSVARSFDLISTPTRKESMCLDEKLLEPADIFRALEQIGPQFSQPLFRELACGDNYYERRRAIRLLAFAEGDQREESSALLKRLLLDPDRRVRLCAAVSLQLMDHEDGYASIIEFLAMNDYSYDELSGLRRFEFSHRKELLPALRDAESNVVVQEQRARLRLALKRMEHR